MQIKPDSSVTHNNFQGGECQTRGAEIHGLTPDFWPASQNQLQRHFWCGILESSCRNLLFAWEQSQPCKEKPFSHWCGQRDLGNHHKIWGCLSISWNHGIGNGALLPFPGALPAWAGWHSWSSLNPGAAALGQRTGLGFQVGEMICKSRAQPKAGTVQRCWHPGGTERTAWAAEGRRTGKVCEQGAM